MHPITFNVTAQRCRMRGAAPVRFGPRAVIAAVDRELKGTGAARASTCCSRHYMPAAPRRDGERRAPLGRRRCFRQAPSRGDCIAREVRARLRVAGARAGQRLGALASVDGRLDAAAVRLKPAAAAFGAGRPSRPFSHLAIDAMRCTHQATEFHEEQHGRRGLRV